jgi:hypothetical protein
LEAFLACPVKCHLLSKQELPEGTEYSTWAIAREDSCRQATVRKLTIPETKPYIASPEPGVWKSESWQFAVAKTVRTEGWEAEIAMIQQIPQAGSLSRFVSIHFVANNKLSSSEKTIAAFEAIVLAKALGRKTDKAKIVYGEKQAMLTVNAAALSRSVHRKGTGKVQRQRDLHRIPNGIHIPSPPTFQATGLKARKVAPRIESPWHTGTKNPCSRENLSFNLTFRGPACSPAQSSASITAVAASATLPK